MNHHQGPSEYYEAISFSTVRNLSRKAWDKYKKGKLFILKHPIQSTHLVATTGSCTLHNQICTQTVNLRELVSMLFSFSATFLQNNFPLHFFHAIFSAFSLTSCLHHTYCATLFNFHHFGDMRSTHSNWCSGLWATFFFFFTLSRISVRLIDALANCLPCRA